MSQETLNPENQEHYGVDAVSGQDESNYPHIEEFMNSLQHDHEVEHAMYHGAKRLASKSEDTNDHDEDDISMDDYNKLKKDKDGYVG